MVDQPVQYASAGVTTEFAARGLVWNYDLSTVPNANRQIANGAAGPTDILTVTLQTEVGRWYAYKFTGPIIFETAGNGGKLEVAHNGTPFSTLWQGYAPGAAQPFRISGWSRSWQAQNPSMSMRFRMYRGVGTGAFTIDIAFGEAYLEMLDIGSKGV